MRTIKGEGIFQSAPSNPRPEQLSEQTPLIWRRDDPERTEPKTADPGEPFKFRYLICALVVWGLFVRNYEAKTLAVASIRMVSNNVVANSLTNLKVGILSGELLGAHAQQNAAQSGTCPIMISSGSADSISIANNQSQSSRDATLERGKTIYSNLVSEMLKDVRQELTLGHLVNWTTQERGWILSAQPIGALLGTLPLSRLGIAIGSKPVITMAFISSTLHPLLLPTIVLHCPTWFIIISEFTFGAFSEGCSAVFFPFLATWLLPEELAAFAALYMFGQSASSSSASFLTTQMLAADVSWDWCFVLPGAVMFVTLLLWLKLGADSPRESKLITNRELEHLSRNSVINQVRREDRSSLRGLMASTDRLYQCACPVSLENSCPALQIKRVPIWSSLLTDSSIWAQIFASFAYHWRSELWTLWPTFFATMLHIKPSAIGIIISSKAVAAVIYGFAFAILAKKYELQPPFNWKKIIYWKFNYFLATVTSITSSLLMMIFDCSSVAMVFSVILTPLINGFVSISYLRLPVDQSPEDSGLISSYVRLLSPGDTISVPVASYILAASSSPIGDRSTWKLVWGTSIIIDLVACTLFLGLAQSDKKSYSKVTQVGECQSKPECQQ